jgi:hypothetical protein
MQSCGILTPYLCEIWGSDSGIPEDDSSRLGPITLSDSHIGWLLDLKDEGTAIFRDVAVYQATRCSDPENLSRKLRLYLLSQIYYAC